MKVPSSNRNGRPAVVLMMAASLAFAFWLGRQTPPPALQTADHAPPVELLISPPTPPDRIEQDHSLQTDLWREPPAATPHAAERTLKVLRLLENCASTEDFDQAIDTIRFGADKSEVNRYLAMAFAAWLDHEPLAALAEVRRIESLRHDTRRVSETFAEWARLNPAKAAEVLRHSLDGRQRNPDARPPFLDGVDPPGFFLSLVHGLGLTDPALAGSLLQSATPSPVVNSAIKVLIQNWHFADSAAVQLWAEAVDDPILRATALETAALKGGQKDDTQPALAWAMSLTDDDERVGAVQALVGQWSQRRSADAFEWARQLPDGNLKFEIMPKVLRQVAILDPGSASDWLNEYEAGPQMDASIAAYAMGIRAVNPAAAIGSAGAISDDSQREAVVLRIVEDWTARDPEAAREYLRNETSSPEPEPSRL